MSAQLPLAGAVPDAAEDYPTTPRRAVDAAVPVEVARDAPATTPVPGMGTITSAGPLALRIVDEDREVPLDADPFSIGRDARNNLVLADEGVSAFHCRIRRAGRRLLLEDRGSTNGTFLNDVRVFASELRVGGRIGLARRRLRLCGPAMAGPHPFSSVAAARYAIVGQDSAVVRLVERIERVAPTRATVLIVGESGSGKELVARALHVAGERPSGPFVVLNCAAIARELAESELFGHERGAFTGAVARHRGVFEEATGGTLFLDEIGELAPPCRPSCCGSSSSARCGPSVAPTRSGSRCGWWPPRTAASPTKSRRGASASTCITGWPRSRSRCRPCALDQATCRFSARTSSPRSRRRWGRAA